MIIRDITVTPIAFRDPPLLNAVGLHEPLALRTIVQLHVEGGIVGLGEGSGGMDVADRLRQVADEVIGLNVFDLNGIEAAVNRVLGGDAGSLTRRERREVYAILDVAAHDAQGHLTGLPVSELLGGRVRDSVDYSAYLFYKYAGHPDPARSTDPADAAPDEWGAALDPAGIVAQARTLIERYGFSSIKLKAGVFPPEQEVAAMRALAEAFPGYPLRIDPNGAWSHETAVAVCAELGELLEYFEDPVLGIDGMAAVAREVERPLATNMCVVAFEHLPEAFAKDAVQIVLSDHHYWGGLRHTRELAAICGHWGVGVSMHSNSHLGISLAAMTHVAAATPELAYACDTHYPWNREDDIVRPGVLEIVDGAVAVPRAPGLGVELDPAALERQHQVFLDSGRTHRDDSGYIQQFQPDFSSTLPRF
ncbi:glucarate dehydratase family protein [Ruania rhizosphaerae]|uniref:glucarate dehydratase family protein n=1 Tax=Ruania rhizosphaerae TaxID=1840413 RepID=UPI0013594A9D|nr:glucarate dehydratase family protein [Ruania rhizosphaerae]